MSLRVAIVGTAPSWTQTPWNDPTLQIWSLNDAYMNGLPRADAWFDQHPLSHFYYRPKGQKVVYAEHVPYGFYVRPEGHIEWLQQQSRTIPVYLQADPPAGFGPHARRFPLEEVEAAFGKWEQPYDASGPSYMLALAMLQGATEIHVYGIHLSTAHEYREQRPQWEFLLGRYLGRTVTQRTEGQVRIYEGAGVRLVLPVSCPILTHGWRYAYQPKPLPHPASTTLAQIGAERQQLLQRLATWPRWKSKAPQMDRLARLAALEQDCQLQLAQQQG